MVEIKELLDLDKTIAKELFDGKTYPWEVLDGIKEFILKLGPTLDANEFDNPSEGVWVAKDAKVFPSAYLGAPCIIDHGAEIRHCAFIRGSAIVGKNAVVGNSVELKNVVLFDNVQTPHFNYVGDSILGYKAHMGAGSITSNVKSDKTLVVIKNGAERIETGRKKVGAILGGRKYSIGNDYSRDLAPEAFARRIVVVDDPLAKIASWPAKVQEAVRQSRVTAGMTREQVAVALGYPVSSENPDLDAPLWRYWLDSFTEFQVEFDGGGRVTGVIALPTVLSRVWMP